MSFDFTTIPYGRQMRSRAIETDFLLPQKYKHAFPFWFQLDTQKRDEAMAVLVSRSPSDPVKLAFDLRTWEILWSCLTKKYSHRFPG